MTELEKYIQAYFGVSNQDLTLINSFFKVKTLKKGDFFLKTAVRNPCENRKSIARINNSGKRSLNVQIDSDSIGVTKIEAR